jgi:hypothetical protein
VISELYRRHVASLDCAECGISGSSQCAHANSAIWGKSRGKKASDIATFPLCCDRLGVVGCHTRFDQYIGITREEAAERETRYILQTILTLANAGKLKAVK